MAPKPSNALRECVFDAVRAAFGEEHPPTPFVPGNTYIPVAGRVFGVEEVLSLVGASLDFWLTEGPYASAFERRLATQFGLRHATFVNSGSSANLLAVTALTSPRLENAAIRPGDEIITVAAGFPTTVNPILQIGAVPVFVDISLPTYNVNASQLEQAVTTKTRAVVLAHALGNPFDVGAVSAFCERHGLWLIEDCCDALGSLYAGKHVGAAGDLATCSFYPAHHVTTGEGGCVLTDKGRLRLIVESFRDWGRDCWCEPGCDNTCNRRFDWQLGDLPHGYDHKYTYSHIGYNLKATDLQAAVGIAQLTRLPDFVATRRRNFERLHEGLRDLDEHLILPEPTPDSEPSWFGFPIALRPESPVRRHDLVLALEQRRIGTRQLFAGNVVRQPAYQGANMRIATELVATDYVTDRAFWFGVYPGITNPMVDYMVTAIHDAVEELLA